MLQLRPKIHPIISNLLSERRTLFELVRGMGGSINIVFPQILAENTHQLNDVINILGVQAKTYYAHKTNQSSALVRQARMAGVCIDVASLNELKHALACGFNGENILATGPKTLEYLHLAVAQQVLISVDNLQELEQIVLLAKRFRLKQPVLLRISGFSSQQKPSRFGIPIHELDLIIDQLNKYATQIDLKGVAFHLDTSEPKERIVAIQSCLDVIEKLQGKGFSLSVLDIGGGFRQVFMENGEDLEKYASALKSGLLGKSPPLHWPGVSFGYRLIEDRIEGVPTFHRYANNTSVPNQLTSLLSSPLTDRNDDVVSVLKDSLLDLYIEPGKSLVDHAGITVTRVESVKKSTSGEVLIQLNIKRDDLIPADQTVMLDPVILHKNSEENYPKGEYGVFFAGNLCLEKNLIYNHKTFLSQLPLPGDVVVFINTAAYQMDLSASEALMQPKLRKVAIIEHGKNFEWFLDEHYLPI